MPYISGGCLSVIPFLVAFVTDRPTLTLGASFLKEVAVDIALRDLRTALLRNDGATVLDITDDLRKPFVETKLSKSNARFIAKADQPDNRQTVGNHLDRQQAPVVADPKPSQPVVPPPSPPPQPAGECIFDDHLFSLTPTAKAELKAELQAKDLHEAVSFVRRGGWWDCGTENSKCECAGNVQMVDIDRNQIKGSTVVDAAANGGSVECTGKTFGISRPATPPVWPSPQAVSCECKYHKLGEIDDGFHLEKRLSSKSRLQEGWIFLLRLLARTYQIPTGTGDRTYSGMDNWSKRGGDVAHKFGQSVVLERFWLIKYMRDIVWYAVQGPRCLEWGNPSKPGQELIYSGLVPGCALKYDMQYDHIYWSGGVKHVNGNVVHSDIMSLPDVLWSQGLQMDAIFATQVFEHIANPFPAAEALYKAIAPGGVLIVTAPQQAQFHKVPHDYFRYTKEGLKFMLVKAGFCVPNQFFVGGGDFVFDIGRAAGLQVQDFALEEMEAGWQIGYDKVSDAAITIHALAFKTPSQWCSNSTAGWQELQRQGIGLVQVEQAKRKGLRA